MSGEPISRSIVPPETQISSIANQSAHTPPTPIHTLNSTSLATAAPHTQTTTTTITSPVFSPFVPGTSASSSQALALAEAAPAPGAGTSARRLSTHGKVTSVGANGKGNGNAEPSSSAGVTGHHRSVGPELSTPARLQATSNGTFVPTGEPPYTPPDDVVYPPEHIPNPHVGDMRPQPVLENLAANSLFRPKYLPADIDDRLDKTSVWMGVEKDSSRAVYFLPPTCQCCKHPAVAQHCDRGWPHCARCLTRGVTCIPGVAWGVMRPKGKRRNLKAEIAKNKAASQAMQGYNNSDPMTMTPLGKARYTSAEKGKERAPVNIAPRPAVAIAPAPASAEDILGQSQDIEMEEDGAGGRGKRIKKKRRLSAAGEVDPNSVNFDGSAVKKARRRNARDSFVVKDDTPLTPADEAYLARLETNAARPPLTNMRGPCPVWAHTRSALQAAAEYLRDPKMTLGASVEIGAGGVARGVILEGNVQAQGVFWGEGKDAGVIMTSIGHPRRQRRNDLLLPSPRSRELTPTPVDDDVPAESFRPPSTPPYNILPSVVHVNAKTSSDNGTNRFWAERSTNTGPVADEAPEISALLMAQRARTPIAVAVAQDYVAVPFKIPRPFIVLGWFWVTDAWLEPIMPDLELFTATQKAPSGPPDRVIWKFRFQWCSGEQDQPWWTSNSDPSPARLPNPPTNTAETAWTVSAPGLNGSTTVYACENCKSISERVYATGSICLDETCPWFFGDAASTTNHIGPANNVPATLRPCERITPETLGLRLRPPEPNGKTVEIRRDHLGREFWRGWVCRKCGLAQERTRWIGWNCEACGNAICPRRRIYTDTDLRPPSRPICTGPRQEDGYATWPFAATRSWSLFADGIKVVKHTLEGLGDGTEVHHALHHEAGKAHEAARAVLEGLQEQGSEEIPFRRSPFCISKRAANTVLSPFYTYLNGPENAPPISSLPTNRAVGWTLAPVVCLDTIDLINEHAGRMFPGQREFNSLLVAVNPPALPSSLQPRLILEPDSMFAFMYLGSDGSMKVRRGDGRGKQGEMTIQHGDVVGIKVGSEAIEVSPRMDGFGFLCIARQVREGVVPIPPADKESKTKSKTSTHTSTAPAPLMAPPKPTKLLIAPLTDWYIGGYPLDKTQPLRVFPLFRERDPNVHVLPNLPDLPDPSDPAAAGDQPAPDTETGGEQIIYLTSANVVEFKNREFAPLSPMPLSKELEAEQRALDKEAAALAATSASAKKPTGKAAAAAAAAAAVAKSGVSTPQSGRKAAGTKKGPRKSGASVAVGTPTASVGEALDSPAGSVAGTPGTPSRGGGRGRGAKRAGRGRKSGVDM